MARKKRARRKPSAVNKLANGLLLALAFSRPLTMLFKRRPVAEIVDEATAGLSIDGRFRPRWAMRFYGPVAAAFILFEVKKHAMRKMRV